MKIWKYGALSAFIIGAVVSMVFLAGVNEPIVKQIEQKDREWTVVAGPSPAAFATGGVTGIVGIYVVKHWNNGSYDDNLTDIGTKYAYEATHYNKTLGGNVPANTAFDIIITARISNADIINGTSFQVGAGSIPLGSDWCRMNLTCPHTTPAIGALTAASGRRNVTDQSLGDQIDCFVNFYWNASVGGGAAGAGYQIGNGVHANATAFTLEIYE